MKSASKTKQFQIRFTAADRALLDQLAKERKISRADIFSRALNQFANGEQTVTIHDHMGGKAHCVDCNGPCRLRRDDLALTTLIRCLLESLAATGWKEIPDQYVWPLNVLLGAVRCKQFWKRAMKAKR